MLLWNAVFTYQSCFFSVGKNKRMTTKNLHLPTVALGLLLCAITRVMGLPQGLEFKSLSLSSTFLRCLFSVLQFLVCWWTGGLTNGQTGGRTGCDITTDRPINRSTDWWLTYWLTNWLTDWLAVQLTIWLNYRYVTEPNGATDGKIQFRLTLHWYLESVAIEFCK